MKTFDNLILIGRTGGGKSEFIDFLKKLELNERIEKFRIGNFKEIDDFPWLWEKFEEDDFWEKQGRKRLCSKRYPDGNMGLNPDHLEYLDLMIEKFNIEINRKYLSNPSFYEDNTLFIEFSRGKDDAYKRAFNLLSTNILKRSVIVYNQASFQECMRKNNKRYEEKKQHGILTHKTADEIFEKYYNVDDWEKLSNGKAIGVLELNGVNVPFVTINNEPESTDLAVLTERYSGPLIKLFDYKQL